MAIMHEDISNEESSLKSKNQKEYGLATKAPYLAVKGLGLSIPKYASDLYNLLAPAAKYLETGNELSFLPDIPEKVEPGFGLEKLIEKGEQRFAPGIGKANTPLEKGIQKVGEYLPIMGPTAAIAGQGIGRGLESLGFGQTVQDIGEIAGSLSPAIKNVVPGVIRSRARDLSSKQYDKISKLFGSKKFGISEIEDTAFKVLDKAKQDPAKISSSMYNSLRENITDRLAPILNKTKPNIDDIIQLDQQVGSLAYKSGKQLGPYYGEIKKSINQTLNKYGQIDKEFLPAYNKAKSLWKVGMQRTPLKESIKKQIDSIKTSDATKNIMKLAAGFGLGATAAKFPLAFGAQAGAGAAYITGKTIKSYIDLLKEPAGRTLFTSFTKEAFKKGAKNLVPYADKIDNMINSESKSKIIHD